MRRVCASNGATTLLVTKRNLDAGFIFLRLVYIQPKFFCDDSILNTLMVLHM